MLKILLILIALLGLISFGLIVATNTGSKDEHEAYERYKTRVAKCAYKDERTEEEKILSNCVSEVEGVWKDERLNQEV